MNIRLKPLILIAIFCLCTTANAQKWSITKAPLVTTWGENIDPQKVHQEYPRPTMVRDRWQNLNGLWDFQQGFEGDKVPLGTKLKRTILVPFPWESPLSGIREQFDTNRGWYRREFTVADSWANQRVLLHFGAVDWEAVVYVNGRCVGTHKGGYDSFSFDITKHLNPKGKQEVIVAVYDPSDSQPIAIGKQSRRNFADADGCFYTPSSGIWQTVWLESVPNVYVKDVKIIPDLDNSCFTVQVTASEFHGYRTKIVLKQGQQVVAQASGGLQTNIKVKVENPHLWSPDDPFLYDVQIELLNNSDNPIDKIESYAGMRKISIAKFNDIPRLCLNNKPLYQHGPLDQGFWPDGLHTAPSDEALRWDIEKIKDVGFNMIRKHIKIEPERWYYWCDKMGVLVWQDMPCSSLNIPRSEADKTQFEGELDNMIYQNWNHPSIVVWSVFNEHWGLYDVERLTNNVMALDPSRLVMGNSGIDARTPRIDYEVGHMKDNHSYLPPNLPLVSDRRATVNGEYGALGYAYPGHLWSDNANYTHDYFKDAADKKRAATDDYVKYMELIYGYIRDGLSATVYTQWSDLENEVNGLYTYDRKEMKLDLDRVKSANLKCYQIKLSPNLGE